MKKYLLICLCLLLLPFSLRGSNVVKAGTYDFNKTIDMMGDYPYLRMLFPDMLMDNLFLTKMIRSNHSHAQSYASHSSDEDKIKKYVKIQTLEHIEHNLLEESSGIRKSSDVKKTLILGITLAKRYKGYNLILKPSESLLYTNSSLSNRIAQVVSDYLEKKAKKEAKAAKAEEKASNAEDETTNTDEPTTEKNTSNEKNSSTTTDNKEENVTDSQDQESNTDA